MCYILCTLYNSGEWVAGLLPDGIFNSITVVLPLQWHSCFRRHQSASSLGTPECTLDRPWSMDRRVCFRNLPLTSFWIQTWQDFNPPAITKTVLSAEVIHAHYWWTFSFTDHNSIDPVTAHAESPCWGISAWTVTPRVYCQSWGNRRKILFAVGLQYFCFVFSFWTSFSSLKWIIILGWAQGGEMKSGDVENSMSWAQIYCMHNRHSPPTTDEVLGSTHSSLGRPCHR